MCRPEIAEDYQRAALQFIRGIMLFQSCDQGSGLLLTHVNPEDIELICIRMGLHLEDKSDPEVKIMDVYLPDRFV